MPGSCLKHQCVGVYLWLLLLFTGPVLFDWISPVQLLPAGRGQWQCAERTQAGWDCRHCKGEGRYPVGCCIQISCVHAIALILKPSQTPH
jgi:hypothetical protein